MFEFTFIKNDAKNALLLTIYFYQICSTSAPPKDAVVKCNCEYMSSKSDNNDFLFKNSLALNNKPVFFEILFSMYFICGFQIRFRLRRHQEIFSIHLFGISSFLLGLWKNEYLLFFHIK